MTQFGKMSVSPVCNPLDPCRDLVTRLTPPTGSSVSLPCFSTDEHLRPLASSAGYTMDKQLHVPQPSQCPLKVHPLGTPCLFTAWLPLPAGFNPWGPGLKYLLSPATLHVIAYSKQSDPTPAGVYPPAKLS